MFVVLAKIAAISGCEIHIFPMSSEVIQKFKNYCYDKWKEYFNDQSKLKGIWYKIIQKEPPRIPWFDSNAISRRNVVTAHRVRSGHMPLSAFAYLMRKADSPNCEVCGQREDVYHLLVECVRNEAERNIIIRHLRINKTDLGILHNILA